jgi:hypothetical protein
MFLKLYLNTMIRNNKIPIFLILLSFENLRHLINAFTKKNYKNVHLNVSYDFSKFDGSKKIKV